MIKKYYGKQLLTRKIEMKLFMKLTIGDDELKFHDYWTKFLRKTLIFHSRIAIELENNNGDHSR